MTTGPFVTLCASLRFGLCACLCALTFAAIPVRSVADSAASTPCQRMFDWIRAEPIRFRQSSATLLGTSHAVLERLAEFAYDCPGTRISITGHTDALGAPEYNQFLSEQRARAVADFLAARGIEPKRFIVLGAGASRPVADNNSAYGRERNRRIELALVEAD